MSATFSWMPPGAEHNRRGRLLHQKIFVKNLTHEKTGHEILKPAFREPNWSALGKAENFGENVPVNICWTLVTLGDIDQEAPTRGVLLFQEGFIIRNFFKTAKTSAGLIVRQNDDSNGLETWRRNKFALA